MRSNSRPVDLGGINFSLICGKGKKCTIAERRLQVRKEAEARAQEEAREVERIKAEEVARRLRIREETEKRMRAEAKADEARRTEAERIKARERHVEAERAVAEERRAEASAIARGVGSAPVGAYRRLIGDSLPDVAMQAIETWPASRQHVLASIHRKLEPILEHYHRVLPALETVFNARRIGAKSAYGVVYKACIAEGEGGCWELPETVGETLYLVVKLIKKPDIDTGLSAPLSGFHAAGQYWIGNENPYREILMGRLLNRLVKMNITPHFPMIYESFEVADTNMVGFAMEVCDIDFPSFLKKVLAKVPDDARRIKLFRVAVLQLTHALLVGQKHFDFRHNDFHAGNAMMTLITNSSYAYKFDADELDADETVYEIPNAGMCWKLIDFGYSSSDVFCAEDNQTQFLTSRALTRMLPMTDGDGSVYFPGKGHALEMFDLLRFLHFTVDTLKSKRFQKRDTRASQLFFSGLQDLLLDISVRSPKRDTLMDVSEMQTWREELITSKLENEGFKEKYISSSGLLQKFFKVVARPFKVRNADEKRRVLAGNVFNADAHPFLPDEALTGLEAAHFLVNPVGELVPLSARTRRIKK